MSYCQFFCGLTLNPFKGVRSQVEKGLESELRKLLTGCKQKCCLRNMGCTEGHAGSARGLVVSRGFQELCSG